MKSFTIEYISSGVIKRKEVSAVTMVDAMKEFLRLMPEVRKRQIHKVKKV